MNKKVYEKVLSLNKIYKILISRAEKCQQLYRKKGKAPKFVWANKHYERFKDKYICEFYPIPVIDTDGVGDIGFNINECFYEGYFSKEKLLGFDLDILKDVGYFSIYGENDYLVDIYNSNMDFDDIKSLINDSSESKIAINFAFKYKDLTKIIDILLKLTKTL